MSGGPTKERQVAPLRTNLIEINERLDWTEVLDKYNTILKYSYILYTYINVKSDAKDTKYLASRMQYS